MRLHHFIIHVVRKTITIKHISTKDQIADIFTKTLREDHFYKLDSLLMNFTKETESFPPVTLFIYEQYP